MAPRQSEIGQACVFGAVGLLSVGLAVHDLVLNRPLRYEFALGLIFLIMAAQLVAGASQEARDWVYHAFGLLTLGIFLPQIVENAVESAAVRSVLAAMALVTLLVAAGWLVGRSRRRSRPGARPAYESTTTAETDRGLHYRVVRVRESFCEPPENLIENLAGQVCELQIVLEIPRLGYAADGGVLLVSDQP